MEIHRGALEPVTLKTILRDHADRPHSICAHPGERASYSFASIISDLDAGRMEVAVGPPCEHEYATYEVTR
jgi:isopenicillin-N N-acyltransferase-like protein